MNLPPRWRERCFRPFLFELAARRRGYPNAQVRKIRNKSVIEDGPRLKELGDDERALRSVPNRINLQSGVENDGAGEGNRTLVFSLEGCCSTIELHPRQVLTYHAAWPASTAPGRLVPQSFLPKRRPLTGMHPTTILLVPLTTKGGDPVSYLKRCHLAGIAG